MTKKLIIFGVGQVAELAHFYFTKDSKYRVEAFVVDSGFHSVKSFLSLPVFDFETAIKKFKPNDYRMFVAIGYSNLNYARKAAFDKAKKEGYKLTSYVSSKASILTEIPVGENCFILEDNTIQPLVEVGNNVTLWSGNHIGHHSKIGSHTFISSHVVVSGNVLIGEQCFLGVNSTIRDGIELGDRTVVGAGSLIMKSAPSDSVFIPKPTQLSPFTSDRLGGI